MTMMDIQDLLFSKLRVENLGLEKIENKILLIMLFALWQQN